MRIGNTIAVASTAAIDSQGKLVGANDPEAQTLFILKKIETAVVAAGANTHHIIRTRIYLRNIEDWHAVGKAHKAFFGSFHPATTVVEVSNLMMEGSLVEVEAEAIDYAEALEDVNTEL